jgi:hypothetical protein
MEVKMAQQAVIRASDVFNQARTPVKMTLDCPNLITEKQDDA